MQRWRCAEWSKGDHSHLTVQYVWLSKTGESNKNYGDVAEWSKAPHC